MKQSSKRVKKLDYSRFVRVTLGVVEREISRKYKNLNEKTIFEEKLEIFIFAVNFQWKKSGENLHEKSTDQKFI